MKQDNDLECDTQRPKDDSYTSNEHSDSSPVRRFRTRKRNSELNGPSRETVLSPNPGLVKAKPKSRSSPERLVKLDDNNTLEHQSSLARKYEDISQCQGIDNTEQTSPPANNSTSDLSCKVKNRKRKASLKAVTSPSQRVKAPGNLGQNGIHVSLLRLDRSEPVQGATDSENNLLRGLADILYMSESCHNVTSHELKCHFDDAKDRVMDVLVNLFDSEPMQSLNKKKIKSLVTELVAELPLTRDLLFSSHQPNPTSKPISWMLDTGLLGAEYLCRGLFMAYLVNNTLIRHIAEFDAWHGLRVALVEKQEVEQPILSMILAKVSRARSIEMLEAGNFDRLFHRKGALFADTLLDRMVAAFGRCKIIIPFNLKQRVRKDIKALSMRFFRLRLRILMFDQEYEYVFPSTGFLFDKLRMTTEDQRCSGKVCMAFTPIVYALRNPADRMQEDRAAGGSIAKQRDVAKVHKKVVLLADTILL